MSGARLEVDMWKKCTVWRDAHFQVKMHKTHMFGPLLGVQMSKKCTLLRGEARLKVGVTHVVLQIDRRLLTLINLPQLIELNYFK